MMSGGGTVCREGGQDWPMDVYGCWVAGLDGSDC